MKLHLPLAAALYGLAVPLSAHAADVATLGCIREQLAPETIDAISASTKIFLLQQQTPEYDRALMEKVYVASRECQSKLGWSTESRDLAALYTLRTIDVSAAQIVLRADGVDPLQIEASFRTLPVEARESIASGRVSKAAAAMLATLLKNHGIPLADTVRMSHAVLLVGMIVKADHKRAAFASS